MQGVLTYIPIFPDILAAALRKTLQVPQAEGGPEGPPPLNPRSQSPSAGCGPGALVPKFCSPLHPAERVRSSLGAGLLAWPQGCLSAPREAVLGGGRGIRLENRPL